MNKKTKNRKVAVSIFAMLLFTAGIVWTMVTESVKNEHKGILIMMCLIVIGFLIGNYSEILKIYRNHENN